jgi:hypothetical protein
MQITYDEPGRRGLHMAIHIGAKRLHVKMLQSRWNPLDVRIGTHPASQHTLNKEHLNIYYKGHESLTTVTLP